MSSSTQDFHARDRSSLAALSVDEWMFLALFATYAFPDINNHPAVAGLFVILVCYLTAGFLLNPRQERLAKFLVLSLGVGMLVLVPSIRLVFARHVTAPYLYVHDGLIQIEEAAKFLLAGKNPYVENYLATPMANWDFRIGNIVVNPALYHNAYLPFFFLFVAPFYLLSSLAFGWFDGRMVLLPLFLAMLPILASWVKDHDRKYALLLFVAFNPLFAPFLVMGRNDVFVLFWLVLSIALLRAKHPALSLVVLGLACASKLTAWFIVPFYMLFTLQPPVVDWRGWTRRNWRLVLGRAVTLCLPIAVIVLPFFLWQPAKFIDDIWNYPNGTSTFAPYPVYGLGLNSVLQAIGIIPEDAVRSPFEVLQWIVGLPLLFLLLLRQLYHNSLQQLWFSYALLLSVMGFFSHVLNDNHIGFILSLFAISAFVDDFQPESGSEAA